MIVSYVYPTKVGTFKVQLRGDSLWVAEFEDEELGSYATAAHAVEDLAGGHTSWPSCGDPSQFELPADLGDWTPLSLSR